jgi:hypothetical protein
LQQQNARRLAANLSAASGSLRPASGRSKVSERRAVAASPSAAAKGNAAAAAGVGLANTNDREVQEMMRVVAAGYEKLARHAEHRVREADKV